MKKEIKNSKKNKIAMIGHKRIPSREGGIEIVVEKIVERLVRNGYGVTVYNRKGHHVSGKEFDATLDNTNMKFYKGARIISVPTIDAKGLAAVSSSFFATIRALFGGYDCIHYHAEGPSVMLFLPHLFGIRTVVTIHGLDWQRSKWKSGFASKYLKLGEKIAAKYADEIIVLSKNVQAYFMETYDRKTNFIPNGIDAPVIRPVDQINKKWGLVKDDYFLFLGRIVPEKGVQYLIDSFARINTNKRLVIAGGASDSDDFMKDLLEKSKEDKRVLFTGFVQGEILDELYSNAYVYVLPSDLEGMPISLLEAMSYGNCCITSDIKECTEVVGENALSFERGNVDDLAKLLDRVLKNPEVVYEKKKNAAKYILENYNWDDVVRDTEKLYEKDKKGEKVYITETRGQNENFNGE